MLLERTEVTRYIKFSMISIYEDDYYCTLSQIKAYGTTVYNVIAEDVEELFKDVKDDDDLDN